MIITKNRYPGWCGGSLNIVDVGLIYKDRFQKFFQAMEYYKIDNID